MDAHTLSKYTGLREEKIKRYSTMSTQAIYTDADYLNHLHTLDREFLIETLPLARKAYEEHLPDFAADLQDRYRLPNMPMSAFTLGNWVLGVLEYPTTAPEIIKMHGNVPGEVVANNLEDLLQFLGDMPHGSAEWQQALCLLAFPLMMN